MSQPPKRKATSNAEGSGARPGQPAQRPRAAGSGGGSRPAGSRPASYNSRGRAPQPPPPTTSPLMWVGIAVGVIVVLVLAYVLVSPPWKSATIAAVNPTPTTAASSNTGNTAPPPTTGVSNVNTSGQPQHITVQHILIGFKDAVGFQGSAPPKAAARTQEEAKTLAYQVLDMAKKGQDYDQLVAQYTDDQAPGHL